MVSFLDQSSNDMNGVDQSVENDVYNVTDYMTSDKSDDCDDKWRHSSFNISNDSTASFLSPIANNISDLNGFYIQNEDEAVIPNDNSTSSIIENSSSVINVTCNLNDYVLQNSESSSSIYDLLVEELVQTRSDNPKSLIIGHVNINSLKKEGKAPITYFKDILTRNLLDVLCISESKLDNSISKKDLDCGPSFKCHRKDKESTSGGLCMWIRSDIPQQRMNHLEFDSVDEHIESMIFELTIKKESWYIILTYKNPNVSSVRFINKLSKLYENVISKAKEIILLGDLNIDMTLPENALKNDLCDNYSLSNVITEPTCFKRPEGTLIDPIIVRNSRRFKRSVNVFCGFSDHHNFVACVTRAHVPLKKPRKIKYRSLKNFDSETFKQEVSYIPFHVGDIFNDESDKYWFKKEMFSNLLDEHAPLKQRAIKEDHIPYMNSKLRKEIYKRNMLRNIYKKDPQNNIKWERFRKQRNKVTNMRRQAIKGYFDSLCNKDSNMKSFWDGFAPFMSDKYKSHNTIMLKENGEVISDNKELCEIFACFFSTIANSIGSPDEIDMTNANFLSDIFAKHKDHESITQIIEHHNQDLPEFSFKKVSPQYVKKVLSSIKSNKSTGCDEIPPKVVKLCAEELSVPFADMVNSAFESCEFPDDLKKADLSPLFKKADDMLKENYRPVSILPVWSKVFEIIIADQLLEYFKQIFNNMLCAYRKKYGCNHVVVKLIESWKAALDDDLFAGTLLMDLSKAFDCMPHGLLIAKMKAYGVNDQACKFMASYLSGRFQRVKISDERSSWTPLLKGVPQGSCLGPLLFNIFMNDIFYFIKTCDLINYADDNTLSKIENSIALLVTALQKDAENAVHWFSINLMQANPEKFQCMLMKSFTSKEVLPDHIEVNTTKIEIENCVKLLGTTIDSNLKFDKHVDVICKNASRQINVLYRFKGVFGFKQREAIHNTFILSNFNYCPIVWHFCSKSSTTKMEKIQERALRFLYNDKVSSYDCLLEKCKGSTLHLRRIKTIALEVFKSLNDLNPPFMKEMFDMKQVPYNLRDNNLLTQPKFRKISYGKNSFRYYGSHIWNLLPIEIKNSTTIDHFKDMIKQWEGPNCQCAMCTLV